MEFGLIKSKIEKRLSNSYLNEDIKKDLFIFNELVIKNKDVSKLYSLYSDLAENRGYDDSFANEFVNESIKTIKKINPSKKAISEINMWLSTTKTSNQYSDIDNLVSESNIDIEKKLKSKNNILECIKSKDNEKNLKNVSIESIVEIANKTVSSHINEMDEKTKRDIKEVLYESEDKLKVKFDLIKESIFDKLMVIKESEEYKEVLNKIDKTIEKVSTEKFDKINYIKLKELYKSL